MNALIHKGFMWNDAYIPSHRTKSTFHKKPFVKQSNITCFSTRCTLHKNTLCNSDLYNKYRFLDIAKPCLSLRIPIKFLRVGCGGRSLKGVMIILTSFIYLTVILVFTFSPLICSSHFLSKICIMTLPPSQTNRTSTNSFFIKPKTR